MQMQAQLLGRILQFLTQAGSSTAGMIALVKLNAEHLMYVAINPHQVLASRGIDIAVGLQQARRRGVDVALPQLRKLLLRQIGCLRCQADQVEHHSNLCQRCPNWILWSAWIPTLCQGHEQKQWAD